MVERRQFLGLALGALGGVIATPALAKFLENEKTGLAERGPYVDRPVSAFSKSERALADAIAETILPRTESPGASDAKVGTFLELIYAEWMGDEERQSFNAGFAEVDELAQSRFGKSFVASTAKEQHKILTGLEESHAEHPWYQLGGESAYVGDAPFIAQVKELTVVGFFMSEVGAKQVLRDQLGTGRFDGDIPLDIDESSWNPPPLM